MQQTALVFFLFESSHKNGAPGVGLNQRPPHHATCGALSPELREQTFDQAAGSDRTRDSQLPSARQSSRARSLIGSNLRRLVANLVAFNFGDGANVPASSANVATLFASADLRNVATPAAHR